MTSEQTCPNNDHLKALLDDTLPAEEQSTLEKHLETCSECRLRFERLASGGTLSNGDANVAEALDTPDTALEELKAKLKTEPQSETTIGESPGDAAVSLDFLAPSENPQSLGRLGIYDIRGVIGSGGMGVVLKGHDPRLDRIVAIKVLSPQLASNATARKRFLREAQKAAAVAHEHVVAIHAVDEQDHLPYIVMEYIVGVSLDERIKRSGSLKTEEILRIGMQTASGLAAAHAQGLVHRDVKPSNILLENGVERVKLADFGLARAIDDTEITGAGVVVGTPQYMSPEQARGEPVDHRSDLFGLGCVMYAMCTGRSPFRAATVVDAIRRVCDDTPRRIHKVNPDIPDWLVEIIDRLLAKQPDDRFQSASEVAELLGGHLAHLQRPAVVAQPARLSRVAEASRHSPSRRSWPMWGAALVTVLIVAGVGTHFGGWFRPSPSPEPVASGTDSGQGDVAPPPPGDHALQFDGDDFVALRSISYNGSHPITLEAIIQPELSYPAQVPKVTEAGATTIVGNISGNGGIGLAATPCGIKMAVCGGEAYRNTTAIKTPFPKAAVHVAGVFDPEEQLFTLFVDGQRKAERPFCWSFKPSLTAFVIGAAAPHWKLHGKACPETSLDVFGGFRGTMDEVRISNTTRYTEDFIPEPRLEPDVTTIALYHFDEGTGTIAKDNSGNRNDGIIIGAKWVATEGYTPRPSYASPKPASGTVKPEGNSVDLLALVELPRDALSGMCAFDDRGVVLCGNSWSGLRPPYSVPDEYAVVVDAMCFRPGSFYVWIPTDRGSLGAYFDRSNRCGLDFFIDAERGTPLVKKVRDNPVFPLGRRVRIKCVVQRDGSHWKVDAFADGGMVFTREFDATHMPRAPSVTAQPDDTLCGVHISTYKGGYRIDSLRVQPLNGEGRAIVEHGASNVDCAAAWHAVSRGNPVWVAKGTDEPVRIETPVNLPRGDFRLTGVEFRNRKFTSFSDLFVLSDLPHLKKVDLCGQQWLCGADVRRWLNLPALEELDLANTWITDADIEKLPRLSGLKTLDLSFTEVTDDGLGTLLQCTDLERLILKGTQITDRGIRHVATFRSLKELDLSGTAITDIGLQNVSRIGSLERLVLDHTAVSDAGLSHLSQAKSLSSLSLMHTQVTADGLRKLAKLPALEELRLIGTDISAEDLTSPRHTMASCDIQHHLVGEINLLNAIRVKRDAVEGTWRIEEGQLISPPKEKNARVQVPCVPPDEYILRATICRRSAMKALYFGLPSCGRQFLLAIDSFTDLNGRSGLARVDAGSVKDNATVFHGPVIEGGKPTEVVITVRNSQITAAVGGKLIVDWEGDFKRLSLNPDLLVPREDTLFLGTYACSFAVSKLSLTPISGAGRFLDDASVGAPPKEKQQGDTKKES